MEKLGNEAGNNHPNNREENVLGYKRVSELENPSLIISPDEERYKPTSVGEDFVVHGTYKEIFSNLDLTDKKIANVGAGYPLGRNNILRELGDLSPKAILIPVDIEEILTQIWSLIDSNSENNDDLKLRPVTADATKMPFADNSLDGYISTNLVNVPGVKHREFFIQKLFSEAFSILKEGGFILISSFGYFKYSRDGKFIKYNNKINSDQIVTLERLGQLLSEAGFKKIEKLPVDTESVKNYEQIKDSDEVDMEVEIIECGGYLAFK